MTVKKFMKTTMSRDTFADPANPDLSHSFSYTDQGSITGLGLEMNQFPLWMQNTGPGDAECAYTRFCKFQFYLAPAMAGSQVSNIYYYYFPQYAFIFFIYFFWGEREREKEVYVHRHSNVTNVTCSCDFRR